MALCLATACGTSTSDEVIGEAPSSIIGGTPDAGDPAVVLLAAYPADQSALYLCTGSLIAPDVILTSAHCIDLAEHPGETFGVFLGANAEAYPTASTLIPKLLPVKEVVVHPDYDRAPPFNADIGVVVLAAPLDIPPLPVRVAPLEEDVIGAPARIVGYGQNVYETPNAEKFEADTVVVAIDPGDTITVGDATRRGCIGDSGGPALVAIDGVETIIGVDSYTDLAGCLEPAHYRRTDTYATFLAPYLPASMGSGGSGGAGGASTASSGGESADGSDEPGDADEGCSVGAGRSSTMFGASLVALAFAASARRKRRDRRG